MDLQQNLQLTEAQAKVEDELFNPNDRFNVDKLWVHYRVIVWRRVLSIWFKDNVNCDIQARRFIQIIKWPEMEGKLFPLYIRLRRTTCDKSEITTAIHAMVDDELQNNSGEIVEREIVITYPIADRMRTLLTLVAERGQMLTVRALKYGCFSTISIDSIYYVLERIRFFLQVELYDLRVYGTPKGYVTGNFTITKGEDTLTVGNDDGLAGTVRIQPDILAAQKDQSTKYHIDFETIRGILIVESAAIFDFLRYNDFHTQYKVILVTGCGSPCRATRVFVKQMHKESKSTNRHRGIGVPVFAAGDCNPSGFVIIKIYEDFIGTRIHWIGAWPSDVKDALARPDMHSHVHKWGGRDMTLMNEGNSVDQFAAVEPKRVSEIATFREMDEMQCQFAFLEHIRVGLSVDLLSSRIADQIAQTTGGIY
jgi:hypothetical protein